MPLHLRGDEPGAALGLTSVVHVCHGGGDCEGVVGEFVRFADTMLNNEHGSLRRSQVLPKKITRKATAIADIREIAEKKLGRMLQQNPLRMDYYKRYSEIIADEKDRMTIEETFAKLIELANKPRRGAAPRCRRGS